MNDQRTEPPCRDHGKGCRARVEGFFFFFLRVLSAPPAASFERL